ncbi:hypothetical protein TgHK011_002658 [Trichoderma gracile]|nr:hypothetical protein TgHK011_002658 [Trichoderma gracile]
MLSSLQFPLVHVTVVQECPKLCSGWIVWLQPTQTSSSAAAKCNPSFCLSALLGSDTVMAVVQIYGCDCVQQSAWSVVNPDRGPASVFV